MASETEREPAVPVLTGDAEAPAPASPPEPLIPPHSFWGFLLLVPLIELFYLEEIVRRGPVAIARMVLSDYVGAALIAAPLCAAYVWALPRLLPRVPSRLGHGGLHLVAVVGSVCVGLGGAIPLSAYICPEVSAKVQHSSLGVLPSFLIATIVTIGFVTVKLTYQRLRTHAREVEQRAERASRAAVDAQLTALRARTNPHFLFNSLNAAASLTHEDPARAEETIERLADVFRYALDSSRRPSVRLEEELAAVADYLEIERIRLGERLRFAFDVPAALAGEPIPSLVLQPLVENAVRHGVAPRLAGGRVEVRARREANALVLEVEDDGAGPGGSTHRGSGTSLVDLRERLRLLDVGTLDTRPLRPGAERPGFRARLRLRRDAEAP